MSPAAVTSAPSATPSTAARPGAGVTKGSGDAFDAFLQGAVDATPRDAHGGSRPKPAREHDRSVDKPDAAGAAAARDAAQPARTGDADGRLDAAAGTDGASAAAAATGTEAPSPPPTTSAQAAITVPGLPASTTDAAPSTLVTAGAASAPAAASPIAATPTVVAPSAVAQTVAAPAAAPQSDAPASPVPASPVSSGDLTSPLAPDSSNESPLVPAVAVAGEGGEAGSPSRPGRGTSGPAAASPVDSGEAGATPAPTTGTGGAAPAPAAAGAQAAAVPTTPSLAPQTATTGASAEAAPSAAGAPSASTRPEPPKADPVAAPAAPQPLPGLDRPPTAQPVAAPAPSTPAPQTTLGAQLARPVFTLAAAGAGEHVMTVHVTPDTLGPVTVRAHVGGEGVRVELFAPTDAGRDALRAILPDLRRDLGGAGLTGTLDLSSQNQPAPQHDAPGGRHGAPEGRPTAQRASGESAASPRSTPSAPADGSSHTIDLIV